jgi:hypothetical protein
MPHKPKSKVDPRQEWGVEFFQRHQADDAKKSVPGEEFLDSIPESVAATMAAVLEAVAKAPPPAFSGGGYWHAMHDEMAGYYEVRVKGPKKMLYRLFCVLERDGAKLGLDGPSVVIIDGRLKPIETAIAAREYAKIRKLGDEYRKRVPRSVKA